ncbi:MAG: hypothetical protein EPO20_15610 [Betaproteobacteria bacterium]|nr:MAG: hypothetical protein EPO20_15610 [Betaproteobacteria bacterium]
MESIGEPAAWRNSGRIYYRRHMKPVRRFLAIAALAVFGFASALAQDWPAKPVTMVVPFAAGGPLDVLAARKDLPGDTLADFIPYVRANQAKLQYGSAGVGTSSHPGCVLLNQMIGVDVVHVPYRGGGPAIQDLAAGRIDYLCTYVSNLIPAVKKGSAKAVATLAAARVASFPDVATADEQGLKGFDVSAWNALFLPKGAPAAPTKR